MTPTLSLPMIWSIIKLWSPHSMSWISRNFPLWVEKTPIPRAINGPATCLLNDHPWEEKCHLCGNQALLRTSISLLCQCAPWDMHWSSWWGQLYQLYPCALCWVIYGSSGSDQQDRASYHLGALFNDINTSNPSGDFNTHVDNSNNSDTEQFISLLESFELKQSVTGSPTQRVTHLTLSFAKAMMLQ